MKTEQLKYFLATANTQHIAKAAKQLHISPSAISHSIAALESELGQVLFEKIGKNIYLTHKGKLLAQRSKEILNLVEAVVDELQSEEIEYSGKLRVAASHGLLHRWIIPSWAKFLKSNPNAEVEFYSLRSAQVVEQVSQGSLDFGICFSPMESPLFMATSIRTEALQIAVRKNHPLVSLSSKQLIKSLSTSSCAAPKAFQGIEVCVDHPSLKKAGIKSNVKFVYDSYDVAATMIRESDFWALLPESFIRWYDLKALKIPQHRAQTTIKLISPKGRSISRVVKVFIDLLNDYPNPTAPSSAGEPLSEDLSF